MNPSQSKDLLLKLSHLISFDEEESDFDSNRFRLLSYLPDSIEFKVLESLGLDESYTFNSLFLTYFELIKQEVVSLPYEDLKLVYPFLNEGQKNKLLKSLPELYGERLKIEKTEKSLSAFAIKSQIHEKLIKLHREKRGFSNKQGEFSHDKNVA